jgi:hypothetical protein
MRLDRSSEYRYAWRDPQPSPYVSDERLSGVIVPGAKSPRRLKAPSSP